MNNDAIQKLQEIKEQIKDAEINRDTALLPPPVEQLKSISGTAKPFTPAVIKASKSKEQIATCAFTGITVTINIPHIPGKVLEYVNPLSYYSNVAAIIKEGEAYLRLLPEDVLAGCYLVAYETFGLLRKGQQTATETNALLRTAGKDILINALLAVGTITKSYAESLPKFSVEKATHVIDGHSSLGHAMQEYSKLILSTRFPQLSLISPTVAAELATIDAKYSTLNAYIPVSKPKDRVKAKQSKTKVAENIKEGKLLITSLEDNEVITDRMAEILRQLMKKDMLLNLLSDARNKIVDKLSAIENEDAQKLAFIIKETKAEQEPDIFDDFFDGPVSTDALLTEDSEDEEQPPVKQKKSLAEILAERKAAKSQE